MESCNRMEWKRLLSARRIGEYKKRPFSGHDDLRSEFEKDYHRIIGSSSFRRLQDKTQVFALDKSDFIRTRLTHSLEVSSFAKSLGQNIAQYLIENQVDPSFDHHTKADICDILQCAGLIHDIGNPPFGHFGEEAIRDWFNQNMAKLSFKGTPVTDLLSNQMLQDLYHFEGNAQALRQVTKLHFLVNEFGMNLTFGLLNTIMKYPVSSEQVDPEGEDISRRKMGFFHAEEKLFQDITGETGTHHMRHPLTFILEAADDIAYKTADIEDAFKKGCISYTQFRQELKLAQQAAGEQKLDAVGMLDHQFENGLNRNVDQVELYAIQNFLVRLQSTLIFMATDGFTANYEAIMNGCYPHDLFAGTDAAWIMDALGDIAYRYAFTSRGILEMEIAASAILGYLMDHMVPAILHYDTEVPLQMMETKMVRLISENYRQTYHFCAAAADSEEEKLYLRILLVTDFISGMTDSYAKDLYQKLNGII